MKTFQLCLLVSLVSVLPVPAQLVRVPNTTVSMPDRPPQTAFSTENAFTTLSFAQPLLIASAPGETNRLFVVEKAGRIQVIPDLRSPSKLVFLDLSTTVRTEGEEGLLGLAFHPNYADNGFFYVFYSLSISGIRHQRLARFSVSVSNPNQADALSEQPMINQPDDANNHNGGDLHFGSDGYLYISLGDEGGANDDNNNSQRIDRDYFSGILRIDVDGLPGNLAPNPRSAVVAGTYRVPADNPFIGVTSFNGQAVDPNAVIIEFWAVGLRNPWRMSFDPPTGRLIVGDVGQAAREEIDVIERGGNYGWAFREGLIGGPKATPPAATAVDPIWDYPRSQGISVTGGVVYRGERYPDLVGAYVFADYGSGRIWAMRFDGSGGVSRVDEIASDDNIAGFGVDPSNGDVLLADLASGQVKRLVSTGMTGPSIPDKLSQTGVLSDLGTLAPNPGVVPYQPNVDFWSDHAIKSRWFSLPDVNAKIGFSEEGNWTFPSGALWIKHFDMEMERGNPASARRIETRILVKNDEGSYGVTYRWNAEQTDADLVSSDGEDILLDINVGGTVVQQSYRLPSQAECGSCHTSVRGDALSFRTRQLNRPHRYGTLWQNQIQAMSDAGYFAVPVNGVADFPIVAAADDESHSLEFRVRSYLDVNCAQCHLPGGSALGSWDARISQPLALAGIVQGALVDNLGDVANRVVVPGSTAHSALLTRIAGEGGAPRMPPVGSMVLDESAMDLLSAWIGQLVPGMPSASDDSYEILVNATLDVPAPGVIENDVDFEGDPLRVSWITNPRHGVISFREDGSFSYVPGTDFTGTDRFDYQVSDGTHDSGLATISIRVREPEILGPPAFVTLPLPQEVPEGGTVTLFVESTGTLPIGYRWRRGGQTVKNEVSSSHTSFLTITDFQAADAATYTVVVTNALFFQPGEITRPGAVLTLGPPVVDTDGDGMANDYEDANGFNPDDPVDALLDADGDGVTNLEECLAGTDPKAPGSFPSIEATPIGNQVLIRFQARANKAYTIQYTDSLNPPAWVKLTDAAPVAEDGVVEVTVPNRSARGKRYYRLVTPRQPY